MAIYSSQILTMGGMISSREILILLRIPNLINSAVFKKVFILTKVND